jgi:predicted ATPase
LAAKAPQGLVGANGDACYLPELLRVKGGLLLSLPRPGSDEAESCFMQSIEPSHRHGAPARELRTAIDLAILLDGQGRSDGARTLLQPAFDKFADGSDTADLKVARRLLARLD